MQIEVWSDVICPWCYIGKRRLEMALAQFPHRESVHVIWRSFELDPDSPPQLPGTLEEMLAQKYQVTPLEAAAMNARVTEVAKQVGLDYRLSAARPGNTFDAHRLLHFAYSKQLGDGATERLMHAYFSESLAVGELESLARLAPEFGIAENDALVMLKSDAYGAEVRADEERAANFGITGVPFFVFDGKSGISGAQPVEVFSAALQKAWVEGA
jgi:predicted DsbA family dithiol-disulfide isomerase